MTTASVERRLRLLFANSVVRFGALRKPTFAIVTVENGRAVITLPPGYDDYYTLQTLFHELVHLALPGELAAFGTWEEDILERVAEPNLMHWIVGKPRIHAWWLRQLAALRADS